MGCAANTITLFLNHQPEVIKEKCDCMAAHPTLERVLYYAERGTRGTRNTRNGIRGTHGTMRRKQNGDAHGIDDCSLDRPDNRSLRGRLCRITSV